MKKLMNKKILWPVAILFFALLLWGLFLLLSGDKRVKTVADELAHISSSIRKFYGNRPGYWGLNTQSAIDNKLAPSAMLQNAKIINAFGKDVKIGKGKDGTTVMPGLRGFDIVLEDLNAKECIAVATYRYSEEFLLGVSGLSIDNGTETKDFGWGADTVLPLSSHQAKNICRGENNFLIWHME